MYDRLTISRLSDWDSSSDVSWLDSEAVPEPVRDVHDAVIASDIHLGSSNCQAKAFCCLLESIVEGTLPTLRLVLNGDVFDSFDFRRLRKSHWKVLWLLRKLSEQIEIVWICSNHDGSAEVFFNLLGVEVTDEYIFQSGSRRIIALHGHTFDEFIDVHPILDLIR